jgi:hypothetical protein
VVVVKLRVDLVRVQLVDETLGAKHSSGEGDRVERGHDDGAAGLLKKLS